MKISCKKLKNGKLRLKIMGKFGRAMEISMSCQELESIGYWAMLARNVAEFRAEMELTKR